MHAYGMISRLVTVKKMGW